MKYRSLIEYTTKRSCKKEWNVDIISKYNRNALKWSDYGFYIAEGTGHKTKKSEILDKLANMKF